MTAISWKTGNSGDWNTAADWTGGVVPGSNDAVTIAAAGAYTVTIDHNEAVQSLALKASGATVAVSGADVALTIGTAFTVTAGTLSLTGNNTVIDQPRITGGTLTTGASGTLIVNAVAGDHGDEFDINSAVNLAGTTTIAAGAFLALGNGGALGGTIGGAGELDLGGAAYTARVSAFATTLGTISVEGNGALNFTSVSGTLAPQLLLSNTGTIAIATGITITTGTYMQIGNGALLDYQNDSLLSGPGTFASTNAIEIVDPQNGADQLLLGGGLTLANSGTITDDGHIAMNIVSGDKVTINNTATGTFILEGGDAGLLTHGSFTDGTDTFNNTGLLQRLPAADNSSGFGTVTMATIIHSTGTIDVESGTLALTDGGTLGGTLSGAGTLLLYSGTFALSALAGNGHLATASGATVTFTGSPLVSSAYTLDDNAALAIAAGQTLTLGGAFIIGDATGGGTLEGPGTLSTTGSTTINDLSGVVALSLQDNATWTNTGTVTDSGLSSYNTSGTDGGTETILNKGVFTLAGPDSGFTLAANGTDIFSNTGTLVRTGAGTSYVDGTLNSTGLINIAGGTLQSLRGGGALSGTLSGAGTLALGDTGYTTTGLAGAGTLALNNYYGVGLLTATATSTITDSVQIDGGAILAVASGKILTLTGPLAIGSSSTYPDGGIFSGAGLSAAAGTITTSGSTTIADQGGATVLSLQNDITWVNGGTVTDSGAGSYNTAGVDGGTETILNKGSFTFAGSDSGFALAANGTDVFTNTGTLSRTGSGTTYLNGTLNSSGTINVAGGILQSLRGGGAMSGILSGAGTLALGDTGYTTTGLSGAGTLALNNFYGVGTLTATATATISDSVLIDGGANLAVAAGKILTLTGPLAIGSSTIYPNGAVFSGAGMTAAAGTITTTGVTTIADQAGASVLGLQNDVTWINSGTVTDSGDANYNTPGVDGGTESIVNKGSFTFAGPDSAIRFAASGTDSFTNTGTLVRTGTGITIVDGKLNSSGTINITSGILQSDRGGGALSGTLSGAGTLALGDTGYTTTGLAGGGTLALNNYYGVGTLTATAISTITDSVLMDGGATLAVGAAKTLTLSGPVAIGGSTTYPNGGVFSGPGTLVTAGATTITDQSGASVLGLQNGLVWSNTGTVTDMGDSNYNTPGVDGGTVTVLNKGVFLLSGPDSDFAFAANGTDYFTNAGTLVRSGTGASIFDSRITISNTGTIEAASGTLSLAGGVSGTGILKIDAGATLEIGTTPASQSVTFTGGAGATLQMDAPISRALSGFTAGDRLDFANSSVSTATISGTTLTVVTASSTYTYISAGLAGEVAAIASDGANGSFVTIDRFATATHTPEPLAFGNHHVGDSTGNTLGLTISNTSPADGYSEKLNAGFGGATTGFTASGTITGIAAGASNSTSLTAVLDTSAAGTKTGTATLTLASNGAGVDGHGVTALAPQTVNLTGAVYNYAAASLASTSIALGNQHVGSTPSATLTLTNTAAAGGYSEALDANFTAGTGSATGTGTASLIAAGATDSTALSVGLSPTTSGAASGTETLTFISDGTGTSGLGTTTLGTQAISITGTFYNLAAGKLAATTIAFGNHHVGDAVAARAVSLTNSAPTGSFSEKLNAKFTTASAGLTTAGTITGLAAGASNTTALKVTDTAATAGSIAGKVVLGLVSDGTGTSGLGTTSLPGQTITVTGANFALASGTLATSTLNLGIIHASTAATGALTLTNGAPTGGYGESLDAGLSGATSGLSTAGSITGLLAGATNASTLKLTVNTAATGAYTGSAILGLVSDGAGTSGLGTTALGTQTVNVTATVDNFAIAALEDPSGPALTGSSTNETLNLGTTLQGNAPLTATIGVQNAATAVADQLGGTLTSTGAAGFTNSGLGTFALLSAGQDEHAQTISLATGTAGTFSETVTLSSFGTNTSGYLGALAPETLTIIGTITPSVFHTYTLAMGPNTITGADGLGDIFIASAGALNTRDHLTGGSGANSLVLSGAGLFDINAPSVFTNIPTITAFEGQAASGTLADTRQVVLMRDSATETLSVTAGTATTGNSNPESISIYAYTGTDSLTLAAGADQVFLGTGNATIKLGGAADSVTAGGGTALVTSTAAFAGASVIGTTTGTTTLEITNAGTVTLNAADTNLTVKLDAAGSLKLSPLSFITAIGSSGADTLTAMAGTQTLTGGLGKDMLIGTTGGNDSFADTAAGLNGDTIQNWTTGDLLDLKNIVAANLHPLSFTSGTLTVTDGSNTAAIVFSTGQSLANFTVTGSDGTGGTLIAFHP